MKTEKVLSRDELARILAPLREAGERIVLMNGVFDLLHVGHVRALQDAHTRGDRLVVAVNGDESARGLKGEGRPVQCAEDRAEILAALACVDWVVVFPEPTLVETLLALSPSLHAKGRDYEAATIPAPEREAASSLGIELVFVGDEKRTSSSDLAARASSTGSN